MPSYSRNPWSCVFFIVYLSIELYFIMNLVSGRAEVACRWPLTQTQSGRSLIGPQPGMHKVACT